LHLAAQNGHTATVSLLLEKGADIGTKDNVSNLIHISMNWFSAGNIMQINVTTLTNFFPSHEILACTVDMTIVCMYVCMSDNSSLAAVVWIDPLELGNFQGSYGHRQSVIQGTK
jgi:ankyrin repeat protein